MSIESAVTCDTDGRLADLSKQDLLETGTRILECLWQAHHSARHRPTLSWSTEVSKGVEHPALLPETGEPIGTAVDAAFDRVFAGYCNVAHPLYLGYISPKPLMETFLGDLIAAGLNQTPGAWRAGPAATQIETETLCWLRDFIGLPTLSVSNPGGIFTSGGTMANLTALKLARDALLGEAVQYEGLSGVAVRPTVYMSCEGHFSVLKSADMLGFGRSAVRLIDTDEAGRVNVDEMAARIHADRAAGYTPLCVVGVAGTSATGAIDSLSDLAELVRAHGIWFHVDGAAGAAMAALPDLCSAFEGLHQADSVSLDPCKWLFASFGVGCLFVADAERLRRSFDVIGHYWEDLAEPEFFRMSFYGTRQWRSLGLWLAFRRLGREGYIRLLTTLRDRAERFAEALVKRGDFELLERSPLPVCCFRPRAQNGKSASGLAAAVQRWVNSTGEAYLTLLDWHGETYIRAAFNNYVTTDDDIDTLISLISQGLRQATLQQKKPDNYEIV